MESLGPLVSFFSQKVKDKIAVIRELAQQEKEDLEKRSAVEGHSRLQTPTSGLQGPAAYSSVRSMVESELQRGLVNFSVRTRSGCRNLLRLHRSLLWILLLLQGLEEGPDAQGVYRTPGELCRYPLDRKHTHTCTHTLKRLLHNFTKLLKTKSHPTHSLMAMPACQHGGHRCLLSHSYTHTNPNPVPVP